MLFAEKYKISQMSLYSYIKRRSREESRVWEARARKWNESNFSAVPFPSESTTSKVPNEDFATADAFADLPIYNEIRQSPREKKLPTHFGRHFGLSLGVCTDKSRESLLADVPFLLQLSREM